MFVFAFVHRSGTSIDIVALFFMIQLFDITIIFNWYLDYTLLLHFFSFASQSSIVFFCLILELQRNGVYDSLHSHFLLNIPFKRRTQRVIYFGFFGYFYKIFFLWNIVIIPMKFSFLVVPRVHTFAFSCFCLFFSRRLFFFFGSVCLSF